MKLPMKIMKRYNTKTRPMLVGLMVMAMAIVLTGVMAGGCKRGGPSDAAHSTPGKRKYHCPMHPTYVSDRLGDCPICNMKLVEIKDSEATVPDKHEATGGALHGRIPIALSPEKRQLIGLKTDVVERRNLSRVLRTAALLEHDERRYAKIAPRFAGWVRQLHVNFTGAPIEKDQPLFTVYSPELYSAENEYLIALRSAAQLKDNASESMRDSVMAMLESARLRLALFEVGDNEIRELERRGKASAELLFRSPVSGHLLVKNAVEGKAFMSGETLFEIADLSHLWVRAYVFEFDMPLITIGQDGVVKFPYLNNKSHPAKVTFIYPHIEAQTRRGQIRLELDNPGHELGPEMWADVELELKIGEKLSVPASALIDTGQRYVAFVDGQDGHLEPREVKTGVKTDDYYEVVSGLKEGERVVTRALFLVDSESQLKAAISGMETTGAHKH